MEPNNSERPHRIRKATQHFGQWMRITGNSFSRAFCESDMASQDGRLSTGFLSRAACRNNAALTASVCLEVSILAPEASVRCCCDSCPSMSWAVRHPSKSSFRPSDCLRLQNPSTSLHFFARRALVLRMEQIESSTNRVMLTGRQGRHEPCGRD